MFSKFFIIIAATLFGVLTANNNDPVVLVHGLGAQPEGWNTYRNEFEDVGLRTIAVDIGKFTSAHERAADLYAQLKGTRTDYGVCRSRKFGHQRFGKDFTGQGLFPEWNENNKVHLVGHSYGSTTIVLLEKLLREGTDCPEDTSPLFTGGNKNWITSITSLSGVLSGTTLIDEFANLNVLDLLEFFVAFFDGLFGNTGSMLETDFAHWGIAREPGESIHDFFVRVAGSHLLSDSNTAISTYDLSKKGAREINAIGKLAYDDTFYYAFAVEQTNAYQNCFFFFCGEEYQVPSPFMNLLIHPLAYVMGNLDTAPEERENDGLVNWINQICPIATDEQRSSCKEFAGSWTPGTWFYEDIDYLDHASIQSGGLLDRARELYRTHAARLKSLP